MDGGRYKSGIDVTPERVIASLLVVLWIALAYRNYGPVLAWRAFLLFAFPLMFIWFPELMSRIAGVATKKSLLPDTTVTSSVLRGVGWFVIVGVPVGWFLMWLAARK